MRSQTPKQREAAIKNWNLRRLMGAYHNVRNMQRDQDRGSDSIYTPEQRERLLHAHQAIGEAIKSLGYSPHGGKLER